LEDVDTTIYSWKATESIGEIEQVSSTYSYIDGVYGILNEKQVGIGESTCAARLVNKPVFAGGKALFDVSALSRIALERASSAREAIKIMGDLATKHGYYGAEWEGQFAKGEAGESLSVADPKEVWIFHITPDDTGAGAVWVAQRVPDDHIAVVANAFTIGEINLQDKDNFMASENIHSVAERNNFWNEDSGKPFHFALTYGAKIFFETYCARRQWRVYDLVAPSLKLDPNSTVAQLPFSVKPEKTLSVQDIMQFNRDHYEGTEFDLTKGLAAGPYGNPNRYDRGAAAAPLPILFQGTFERPISMFRTSYSTITQSRAQLPAPIGARLMFSPASPHGSFYAPLYPASHELPNEYTTGSLYQLTRDSLWWAATAVSNYMERMWCYMVEDVTAAQKDIETQELSDTQAAEEEAAALLQVDADKAKAYLTAYQINNSKKYVPSWWALFDHLITKYHDGYRIDDFHAETMNPTALFYPMEWLKQVGFFTEPIDYNATTWKYTVDYPLVKPRAAGKQGNKNKKNRRTNLWEENNSNTDMTIRTGGNTVANPATVSADGPKISYDRENLAQTDAQTAQQASVGSSSLLAVFIFTAITCVAVGIIIGQKLAQRHQYTLIN
jgi:dipeptidase